MHEIASTGYEILRFLDPSLSWFIIQLVFRWKEEFWVTIWIVWDWNPFLWLHFDAYQCLALVCFAILIIMYFHINQMVALWTELVEGSVWCFILQLSRCLSILWMREITCFDTIPGCIQLLTWSKLAVDCFVWWKYRTSITKITLTFGEL